jgi:hypothetical protein
MQSVILNVWVEFGLLIDVCCCICPVRFVPLVNYVEISTRHSDELSHGQFSSLIKFPCISVKYGYEDNVFNVVQVYISFIFKLKLYNYL